MTSCQNIVKSLFFSIYGPFAAIWKPDSRRMVYKIFIFISSNLLFYKT